jgi:hypothetical protein
MLTFMPCWLYQGRHRPVIRIRVEGLKAAAAAELLVNIVENWSAELESGVMLSVQSRRIGVRYLPLSDSKPEPNR